MQSSTHPLAGPIPANVTARREEHAGYIGTPNAAGLFYAACSRDYNEDICGCPVCQAAAHDDE